MTDQSFEYSSLSKTEWLTELAQAVRLREGVEGVIRALWTLQSGMAHSTREWSAAVQIPVPVLAAFRRELEKRDILAASEKRIRLTPNGEKMLTSLFGHQEKLEIVCPSCRGTGRILPPEASEVIGEFEEYCERRPDVDVTLDQSHATPETGVRKALFLLEKGLLGRSLLFIGDDDLISVACWLVRKRFLPGLENPGPVWVLDIDPRYLRIMEEISQGEIQTREYDVRNNLPDELQNRFSAALTDPAYTENGITAFAYRCSQAVENNGVLLLSMPFPDGERLSIIQKNLVDMGWVTREIHPGFNRYHGASLHASQSNLTVCEKVFSLPPEKSIFLRYTPFYTGEVRPPGGMYLCTLCQSRYPVGPGETYLTIQDLKKAGCAECGNDLFRKISTLEAENASAESSPSPNFNE